MNRALTVALNLSLVLAVVLIAESGCKTTPEQAAYRTIGTTAHAVDAAMKMWGDYVGSGIAVGTPTVDQEMQVKSAYLKYQATMRAARGVIASVSAQPDGSTLIQSAINAATDASGELVAMVNEFVVKKE